MNYAENGKSNTAFICSRNKENIIRYQPDKTGGKK